jgi:hypothetical protein
MSDITHTIAPNSDQIDAIDLHHSGPRTFTVERVVVNKSDQPVNIHLREIDRVYRPSKNMRRVLADAWGIDSAEWAEHALTLYCDPEVMFGRDKTGGVRISHVSHIDAAMNIPIIVSRGKSGMWTVKPLKDIPAHTPTEADVQASTDTETLRSWWKHAHLQPAIKARVDELKAEKDAGADAVEPGLFERGE